MDVRIAVQLLHQKSEGLLGGEPTHCKCQQSNNERRNVHDFWRESGRHVVVALKYFAMKAREYVVHDTRVICMVTIGALPALLFFCRADRM